MIRPEQSLWYNARDVLLTMNCQYYPFAIRRLRELGLQPVPVFTSFASSHPAEGAIGMT